MRELASYLNSKRVKLVLGLEESAMLKLRRVQDLVSQKRRQSVTLEEVMSVLVNEYLHRHDPIERAQRSVIRRGTPVGQATMSKQGASIGGTTMNKQGTAIGGTTMNKQAAVTKQETAIKQSAVVRQAADRLKAGDRKSSTWKKSWCAAAGVGLLTVDKAGVATKATTSTETKTKVKMRTPIPRHILHQVNLRDRGRCQHRNIWTKQQCTNKRHIEIHHIQPLSWSGGHELYNLITLCSEHHKAAHIVEVRVR